VFSYIWWTQELRDFGGIDPNTNEPYLHNKFLYVPVFNRDEFLFTITCFVDQLTFRLGLNTVTVRPTPFQSVDLLFSGTPSRPAVHCEGAPDVNFNSPTITLFLAPSVQNGDLVFVPSGRFDTDVDVTGPAGSLLDWIFSIGDQIVGRATTRLNAGLLDDDLKRTLTRIAVTRIIRPYIRQRTGQDVSQFLSVAVAVDGLRVWYVPGTPNVPVRNNPTN